jgi:tetratricopeptide (TPR) repeat protein
MMQDTLWQRFDAISALAQAGRWNEAIPQYVELLRAPLSNDMRAHVLNDLGVAYQSMGNLAQAVENFRRVWELYEQDKNQLGAATALGNLGAAYAQQRHWNAAVDALERSLVVFENRKIENLAVAQLRVDLGDALMGANLPKRACEQYEQALAIQATAKAKRAMAVTLHALGVALRARGKWADGVKAFEQSLTLFDELNDKKNLAATLNRLGELYYECRDYANAVEVYQRDLKLAESSPDQRNVALTLNNLALAYLGQKNWAQAATQYRRAIPLWEKLKDEAGLALALWGRAQLHFEQDEREQALKVGQRARALFEQLERARDEEAVRKWLAMVRRGKRTGLRRYF